MQAPVSVIISGPPDRCRQIAHACIAAGIHPTLLLTGGANMDQGHGDEFHTTSDPFSCVADMLMDCSADDAEAVIARCNQLAEINHGDVVFVLNAAISDLEGIAGRILHPGRVIFINWPSSIPSAQDIIRTSYTTDASFFITSHFIQSLQPEHMK